ncbi:acyl-CoA desaturase [Aetokthonos hydrillicola Thurmond2011]|jgi:linoleoyl-CoA desaturase|uniref:Acyl-CoA desaturase n=1 Tax=Aetokthonos hydrillicola Thurmond2011 TaxID=2712845 RepID=A0AAP5M767_9CYAN|nr:acyl-CoA desaturase [Aetokthonos hydrillicola]MBO3461765.1 acyl-CoA desaturase [Aetokthonos hydrillicola CCALA 1050]MBW4590229.1 acyl-CoA desaturase [Aetokthonos hydrillicola CCALA 1050]MDR9894800.1 acyl-CoA desaturase [Aetokthonos hydrillicola Thurmond2011]
MIQTETKVTFAKNVGFRKELNKRVDAYFESQNIAKRDNLAMYIKTLIIFGWVISASLFTLFGSPLMWTKVIGCILIGFGIAGIGFSVGHDANHGGYSSRKWVNSVLGLTYDIIGVSSYLWRFRHNYLHHTYTNILGHDVEIDGDGLVRMSPFKEYRWYHRFQHIFIWLVYTVIPFYWSVSDIHLILVKRKYHEHAIPTPKPLGMLILLGSKFIWLGLFLGIPISVGYTPLQSLIGFSIIYMSYGLLICTIFMLAHVMDTAEFIQPNPVSNQIDDEWAIFQIRTTVDFAPKNAFLNWYLGGLNYQVVHHLFPQVCHIHYSKIAPILSEVCEEFGVKYNVYETFTEALVANFRWLKIMGNKRDVNLSEATGLSSN